MSKNAKHFMSISCSELGGDEYLYKAVSASRFVPALAHYGTVADCLGCCQRYTVAGRWHGYARPEQFVAYDSGGGGQIVFACFDHSRLSQIWPAGIRRQHGYYITGVKQKYTVCVPI